MFLFGAEIYSFIAKTARKISKNSCYRSHFQYKVLKTKFFHLIKSLALRIWKQYLFRVSMIVCNPPI
ncbi:MAG: hypothetical protein CL674_03835 [Bdellovibrionaceae bacterium]|nr:hypothetical protein [Pseudobdellovibrionaceae bacterium]